MDDAKPSEKREYERPELKNLGSFEKLTQTSGFEGSSHPFTGEGHWHGWGHPRGKDCFS